MEYQVYRLFHLLSILASFFVLSHCGQNVDTLSSCLIDHKVYNFSLPEKDPSTYSNLLHISIHNLRFEAAPSVPKPVAIIIPDSKEQLISSVLCCKNESWQIRVRSGGHSYEGTSYITHDGSPFVLIDIMNLDRVSVDLDSQTAWVEGGATLGQIYYAIAKSSKALGFPAGSCPTVGIGGHISGGGFGLLSRKYGLAADNVVDALLVDSNGNLLDRKSMGKGVFWAIRGGGGGVWGIVFAWKIRLLKVPEVLTSCVVSRPGSKDRVAKLVDKWQHVAPVLVDKFYLSLVVGAGLSERDSTGISAKFNGFYLGRKHVALSILDNLFPDLAISERDCNEMSWIESVLYFSGLKNGSSVSQLKDRYFESRPYFNAKSDFVRTAISRSGVASALDILEKESKGYIILDPYGGAMAKISGKSIPFPHRKGNIFMIQYIVEWKYEENMKSKVYIDWIREFYAAMARYVSSGPRAAYVNYMDFDLGVMNGSDTSVDAVEKGRVWGERYFLKNYDRLVRIKTLIDPLNVFRHEQGIFPVSTANGKA